jgi:hypothetical protein
MPVSLGVWVCSQASPDEDFLGLLSVSNHQDDLLSPSLQHRQLFASDSPTAVTNDPSNAMAFSQHRNTDTDTDTQTHRPDERSNHMATKELFAASCHASPPPHHSSDIQPPVGSGDGCGAVSAGGEGRGAGGRSTGVDRVFDPREGAVGGVGGEGGPMLVGIISSVGAHVEERERGAGMLGETGAMASGNPQPHTHKHTHTQTLDVAPLVSVAQRPLYHPGVTGGGGGIGVGGGVRGRILVDGIEAEMSGGGSGDGGGLGVGIIEGEYRVTLVRKGEGVDLGEKQCKREAALMAYFNHRILQLQVCVCLCVFVCVCVSVSCRHRGFVYACACACACAFVGLCVCSCELNVCGCLRARTRVRVCVFVCSAMYVVPHLCTTCVSK